MTAKHLILIAAFGALLLTGCSKSGVETSPESLSSAAASEQSIGFSTYTGRAVTKATAVLEKDFNVEAFLSGTGTRTLYFYPTAYRYASGSYTGDTVRYWPLDKNQNLDFYAVSPLKYKNTDSGDVDLKPSADSTIVLTKTDGTVDVVAARVLNAPNGDTPAAVSLTFGHKLTKVAFTAVGQDQTKKYVISGLTLTANSTSTYSYAQATDPVTPESWSASTVPYAYDYVSSDVTIAAGTSSSQAVGSAKYLIPDQASTLTATVKYKIFEISGGTDVCIGDNSVSVSLPTESWGINRSVVYNLKLGVTASPVTFTADVADWDTEAGKDITIKPVTSITLSSTALDLKTGETSTLTATVAPEDASNKSISWSSDDTGVATVDEDGLVTAVGAGTATITATAIDGSGVTGTCTVTVTAAADPNLLTGKFTVADGKQVQFTRSNLWWDGGAFKFETNQTDYQTEWDENHVSHFCWTKTAEASYAESYGDGTCTTSDHFFADGSDDDHKLTVEGTEDLYVLTKDEWSYLIESRTKAYNLHKYGVTVSNGGTSYTNCLIIAPDEYSGTALDDITDWSLSNVNSLGLVCLPAAGYRLHLYLSDCGSNGYYWSATPYGSSEYGAYSLHFDSGYVDPSSYDARNSGCCVRLVCAAQ